MTSEIARRDEVNRRIDRRWQLFGDALGPGAAWMERGECSRDLARARLFDARDESESETEARRRHLDAVRLCRRCPVVAECLAYHVQAGHSGVAGGVLLKDGKPERLSYAARELVGVGA